MWRSVLVAVTAAVVFVCTEPLGVGGDTLSPTTDSLRVCVAMRLYAREGTVFVLTDRTESVVRMVLIGDDSWESDTAHIPVGNSCRLTRNNNMPLGFEIDSRDFVTGSDTSINW
jgi:hypothetical protein